MRVLVRELDAFLSERESQMRFYEREGKME